MAVLGSGLRLQSMTGPDFLEHIESHRLDKTIGFTSPNALFSMPAVIERRPRIGTFQSAGESMRLYLNEEAGKRC
jgi:hypothetical protein